MCIPSEVLILFPGNNIFEIHEVAITFSLAFQKSFPPEVLVIVH